ncbi:serine protease persephone [Helicoverpa armigera]|uniref:serine protease persephone n=1 Tax=Helicoverpa armigera TaxID=29058 RepID=UPI0030829A77
MKNWFLFILIIVCVCCEDDIRKNEILNLAEGSKCVWGGVDGVCRSVHQCQSAINDIKSKNYPPICSFEGVKPIICCTDCEPGDFLNLSPNDNIAYYKTGQKATDKCLDYFTTLDYGCYEPSLTNVLKEMNTTRNCYDTDLVLYIIAGGRNADRDQFPHMALLGYGEDMKTAQWLCGGSVISERYILTAAHCISSPAVGQVKYIALGILKRSDPQELWQKYNVKRIIAHPQYKPPSKYHDIALLETDYDISFNSHVLPACLHVGEADPTAEATGWGALGHHRELAEILQTVSLYRFEEEECKRAYPVHRHLKYGYNHTTQMCYGHREEAKDTCEGDSGGPLQSSAHLSDCLFTILGVTSYGRACGFAGGSGMYTRVSHYVPWIEGIVWP